MIRIIQHALKSLTVTIVAHDVVSRQAAPYLTFLMLLNYSLSWDAYLILSMPSTFRVLELDHLWQIF